MLYLFTPLSFRRNVRYRENSCGAESCSPILFVFLFVEKETAGSSQKKRSEKQAVAPQQQQQQQQVVPSPSQAIQENPYAILNVPNVDQLEVYLANAAAAVAAVGEQEEDDVYDMPAVDEDQMVCIYCCFQN